MTDAKHHKEMIQAHKARMLEHLRSTIKNIEENLTDDIFLIEKIGRMVSTSGDPDLFLSFAGTMLWSGIEAADAKQNAAKEVLN